MDQIENIATQAIDSVRQRRRKKGKVRSQLGHSASLLSKFSPIPPQPFTGRQSDGTAVPQSESAAACILYAIRALKLKVLLPESQELNTEPSARLVVSGRQCKQIQFHMN